MECIIDYKEIGNKCAFGMYPVKGIDTNEQFSLDGKKLFSGSILLASKSYDNYLNHRRFYVNGEVEMELIKWNNNDCISSIAFYSQWNSNSYELVYRNKDLASVQIFDMEATIEFNERNIDNDKGMYNEWQGFKYSDDSLCYIGDRNVFPYYKLQNDIRKKTIREDTFDKENVRYIAGIDVGYDELNLKMVVAVVVYDILEEKIIDKKVEEQDVLFNYCNDLFSYREVPILKKVLGKLSIKPDLLLCKGHGIAHPRQVGLATHLGVELDIPAIGCAKDRVLGKYEFLDKKKGAIQDLIWKGNIVGKVYRIVENEKPIFISIGHKVNLKTACEWCMELQNRNIENILPYPLREAEQLVNGNLEERTHIEFIKTEV